MVFGLCNPRLVCSTMITIRVAPVLTLGHTPSWPGYMKLKLNGCQGVELRKNGTRLRPIKIVGPLLQGVTHCIGQNRCSTRTRVD